MRKPHFKSRVVISQVLGSFDPEKQDNLEYLEFQLQRLEVMATTYQNGMKDQNLTARIRARNRDLLMTTTGLINGIKFGLAMQQYRGQDLMELEGLKKSHE
jgi:hypothetical protein